MRRAAAEVKDQGVSLLYREVAKFSATDQIRCIDEMLEHGAERPAQPIQYTRAEILIRQSLSNLTQTP